MILVRRFGIDPWTFVGDLALRPFRHLTSDKKTKGKEEEKEFSIVMSGQFHNLAMFFHHITCKVSVPFLITIVKPLVLEPQYRYKVKDVM